MTISLFGFWQIIFMVNGISKPYQSFCSLFFKMC